MPESRTKKSLRNSGTALILYFVQLIIQFFSRKIFLEYLGSEILGLNTTVVNLLQFLSLAELSISNAVAFSLYKPLLKKDTHQINEIISLQGYLYKRIGFLIIIGAFVLSFFFPYIFKDMKLPLWYAYASFIVMLFSSILGYFFNYKQIILSANQEDYKIQFSYRTISLLKLIAQMIAVYYFSNGYVWWLVMEVVFSCIATISLHITTVRNHPYLKTVSTYKNLKIKYRIITIKIKQLLFHKIGFFVLTQSSPLIIYAFTSLTTVAMYGNYLMVINGMQYLFYAIFNNLTASVGNLVSEGNPSKSIYVFQELFLLRFLLIVSVCLTAYFVFPQFIDVWLGKEYILSRTTLILMLLIMFINISRKTVDNFIEAFGLFKDVWAPIAESTVNIGLSILLGYYWGLNGVLSGVLISLIIFIFIWKPFFLFTNEFKGYLLWYIKLLVKCAVAGFMSCLAFYYTINFLPNLSTNFIGFILNTVIIFIFSLIYLMISMQFFQCGVNATIKRIISIIRKK